MINTKIEINHLGFCCLDMTISNSSNNIAAVVMGVVELSINDSDKFGSAAVKADFKSKWLETEVGGGFRIHIGSHIIDVTIFDSSK